MDDTMRVIDTESKSFNETEVPTGSLPKGLTISKDGKTFIATLNDVHIIKDGKIVYSIPLPSPSGAIAINPSGTEIAVGSEDAKVRIYRVNNAELEEKERLTDNRGAITAIAYSPDGSLLAVGDSLGKIIAYDAESKKNKEFYWGFHTAKVNSIAWSPDSLHAASGSLDTNVYVWSVEKPTKNVAIKGAHQVNVNGLRPSERKLLEPYLREIEKLQNENASLKRDHRVIESRQEEIIKNQLKDLAMTKRLLSETQEDFDLLLKKYNIHIDEASNVNKKKTENFTRNSTTSSSRDDRKALITLQESIKDIYDLIERARGNYGSSRNSLGMDTGKDVKACSEDGDEDFDDLKARIRKMSLQLALCQKELEITSDANQIARDTSKFMLEILPFKDLASRPSISGLDPEKDCKVNEEHRNFKDETNIEVESKYDADIFHAEPVDYMDIDPNVGSISQNSVPISRSTSNPTSLNSMSKCLATKDTDETKSNDINIITSDCCNPTFEAVDEITPNNLNASIKLPTKSFVSFPTRPSPLFNSPMRSMNTGFVTFTRARDAKFNEPTIYRKFTNDSSYKRYYVCEWDECARFYVTKKELK
ncbi:14992_t:CDS:2, partial [Acaulospora colombiana]